MKIFSTGPRYLSKLRLSPPKRVKVYIGLLSCITVVPVTWPESLISTRTGHVIVTCGM